MNKPDHTTPSERHVFYGETSTDALAKLTSWLKENPHEVDIINNRTNINLYLCEETNAYVASIDGRYSSNATLEDICPVPEFPVLTKTKL